MEGGLLNGMGNQPDWRLVGKAVLRGVACADVALGDRHHSLEGALFLRAELDGCDWCQSPVWGWF